MEGRSFAEFPRVDFPGTEFAEIAEPVTDGNDVVEDEVVETGVIDRIEEELADVERALARLDEGTYGRCEVCDAPLADAELEAAPATRFCRAHLPLSLA